MIDKVQKIRAKIERLKSLIGNNSFLSDYEKGCNDGREDMCDELISFIDSLQEEPINDDLEESASAYAREEYDIKNPSSLPQMCRGCYAPLMYAFKAGAKWQKEQMMKNAFELEVKIDAGGYPCIDCGIEFYDYDKDIPLAKEGDKVKVIVVKGE